MMSYTSGRSRGGRGSSSFLADGRSRHHANDSFGGVSNTFGGGVDGASSGSGGGRRGASSRGRGARGATGFGGGFANGVRLALDADGDVVMAGKDLDRRGKHTPYARPQGDRPQRFVPGPVPPDVAVDQVIVTGMPSDTTPPGLASFITKKLDEINGSAPEVLDMRVHHNGGIVFKLPNGIEANKVAQLSGVYFRRVKITVQQGRGGTLSRPPPSHPNTGTTTTMRSAGGNGLSLLEILRQVIQTRYNADARLLDLTNVISDPDLLKAGVVPFAPDSKFGGVMCKMISQQCPEVETLSLASNQLTTLQPFSALPSFLPKLTALSLGDNLLRSLRDIEPLKGADLTLLRELVLAGNPVRERELGKAAGLVVFRSNIKKLFPSIDMLDMEPVVGDITFAVDALSMDLPLPTKPGFMDTPETAALVQDFVQTFLGLFETNRRGLLNLYHDHSSFSLMLDTRSVHINTGGRPASARERDPHVFSGWRNFDHNLEKNKNTDKRVTTIAKGGAKIVQAFEMLPKIKYPPYPGPQYLVEGYQTGTGADLTLYVFLHGEFKEVSGNTNRSFDRTFVIVAAPPGSQAALAGIPYCVANDQMVVRSYAGNKAWANLKAATTPHQPSLSSSVPPPQVHHHLHGGAAAAAPPPHQPAQLPDATVLKQLQIHHQLDDERQAIIIKFATATGLNYQFSLDCLAQNNWSADAAMHSYMNVKDQIPPAAYQLG
ncbi:nuclear mRNA export, poly(A)+RNA binding protein [Geranomyces variabilis]|uniref:Nuclear mRNA export, poly(A)+RNA binding protein n=1 Tax=Geranomyces variabilis TaxID=109894 RepID=A0AAD5TC84_9FUNG|nr:nuclear mRNA export, poly(A)+RNA binding protein [Geranomyces variabilis]